MKHATLHGRSRRTCLGCGRTPEPKDPYCLACQLEGRRTPTPQHTLELIDAPTVEEIRDRVRKAIAGELT